MTSWLAIISRAQLLRDEIAQAARLAHDAIDTARLLANDWRTIWALETDALAAFWSGDADRALASAREMASRAQSEHPFLRGPAAVHVAGGEYVSGEAASACARLTTLDANPTRRLLDRDAAHGWELLVRSHLALGRTNQAKDAVARATLRAEATGRPQEIATVRCTEAAVLLATGQPNHVPELLGEAVALAEAAPNPVLSARAHGLIGIAPSRAARTGVGSQSFSTPSEPCSHAALDVKRPRPHVNCAVSANGPTGARGRQRRDRGLPDSADARTRSRPRLPQVRRTEKSPPPCSSARKRWGIT